MAVPRFSTCFGSQHVRADAGTRTPDPLLTMEVLYQLSYVGTALRSHPSAAVREEKVS